MSHALRGALWPELGMRRGLGRALRSLGDPWRIMIRPIFYPVDGGGRRPMLVAALDVSWRGQGRGAGQDAGDQQGGGEAAGRSEAVFHGGSPKVDELE